MNFDKFYQQKLTAYFQVKLYQIYGVFVRDLIETLKYDIVEFLSCLAFSIY